MGMTRAGGPNGTRAFLCRLVVEFADGSARVLDTADASRWQARDGPVAWDHFFHGA